MTDRRVIEIRKYPNRRYYDATHSRHVTLREVHEMVVAGDDVRVTDSRNGDDITNFVLTQILLEKDEPKLDLCPSAVLHLMIRSDRSALRAMFERFFGSMIGLTSISREQFDAHARKAMPGGRGSPFDWSSRTVEMFTQSPGPPRRGEPPSLLHAPQESANAEVLLDLRRQLAVIKEIIDRLSAEPPDISS